MGSWTVFSDVLDRAKGRTVMVIGGPGTGKTKLARDIVRELKKEAGTVALVSADMGQQSVGVPTCLGLSAKTPRDQASAMWFVGDVSPRGNLLPTVVGTGLLVRLARAEGASTVVIDTTGLVEGEAGRVLKYHKAVAAGVDCVVAVVRGSETEKTLSSLERLCPAVCRLPPPSEAMDRSPAERKAYRQERYRAYFRKAQLREFDAGRAVGADWASLESTGAGSPAAGTVVGLLDQQGFCRGLGLIERLAEDRLVLYAACRTLEDVVRLQVGKLRLDRHADYAEAW